MRNFTTTLAGGAAAAAVALFSAAAAAAPVDLAGLGLTTNDAAFLEGGATNVSVNAVSGSADAFIGSVLVAGMGVAPYADGSFTLTLTDLDDGSELNAVSVARGYSDAGDFADMLFSVDHATGGFAGLSSSLYAVVDLPAGALASLMAGGEESFVTSARLYETAPVQTNVVPLPATGAMLLGALAGAGAFVRRRG